MSNVYKSIKDIPFEEISKEDGDWLRGQTPKIRPPYGRPSKYARAEREWADSYGRKQQGLEYDPFDNYNRAVGNWNKYFKEHKGEDPSLDGVLEWLDTNKSILENPDPKEWVATSYDEDFYNQFPSEMRGYLDNIENLDDLVAAAKGYTKNGEYSPRQMVRYLTGKKHFFVPPYDNRSNSINKILDLWRKL